MTKKSRRPNTLRFVLFKEEDAWVAMCLEHYIGTQGATKDDAIAGLKVVYRAELDESLARTGKPFGGIPRAPDKFWAMHESDDKAITRGHIRDDGLGAGMGERLEIAA